MKKILLICLLGVFASQAYSREMPKIDITVDMKAIEEAVKDTAYYNTLERKFLNFQFLETAEVVNLYYGQAFQKDYSPYDKILWQPKIDKLVEDGKMKEAFMICLALLKDRPAYLPLINYTGNLAEKLELSKDLIKPIWQNEARILIIIASSGDGKSSKSPFKVASVSDERILLGRGFMIKSTDQELTEEDGKHYDILGVEPNDIFKDNKVYFDISLPFNYMEEHGMFGEKETKK